MFPLFPLIIFMISCFLSTRSASLIAMLVIGSIGIDARLNAQSLSITGTISDTVGTTGLIPGSGTTDNTSNWALGTVGVFEINHGAYYMRVSATNPTGGLNPANDSLMVIQTQNSQGLDDTGTLSIYVRPSPATNTAWTLDLDFSFFSDSDLNDAAIITNMMLTSLDIDFNQRYYTSDSTFSSSQTYSTIDGPSAITTPGITVPGYTGFTAAGDSTFNNPRHAVSSTGTGSSFDIQLGHNAVALFMFEFRNPSSIIAVPEPSSALLILAGISTFGLIRRRTCAA